MPKRRRPSLHFMTKRAIRINSYILTPFIVGLALIAEPLINLILTEKWIPCVKYLQIYCLFYCFIPIQTANLQAIKALGRSDMYLNLDKHFVKVGLAYRILPVANDDPDSESLIDTETMYDNMMNKFEWGGVDNPNVYLDETTRKMTYTMRMLFIDLAEALIMEEKYDMALNVLDKMMEKIPATATKHDYLSIQPAMAYYSLGEDEKGESILTEVADNSMEYMKWFRSLEYNTLKTISQEYLRHEYTLKTIIKFFIQQGDEENAKKYLYALDELGDNLFKES